MASKLGLHWVPQHVAVEDLEAFAEWQPPVVLIVDGDWNRWTQAHDACPNALFIARDWALSEQKDDVERDPEGTGRRHAEEWHAHLQTICPQIPWDQVAVCGINEPPVWVEGGIPRYVAYSVAFLDRLHELGRRGMALNLSVGWPANTGTDTPVDWSGYAPVLESIKRGGHVLGLHEYWDTRGPGFNWRWWGGRYLQCPWDVPIVITECGLDQHVNGDSRPEEARGWQTNGLSREAYMGQLVEYDGRICEDRRIIGAAVFTWDFNPPWGSFDVRAIRDAIVGYALDQRKSRNDAGGAEGGDCGALPGQPPGNGDPVLNEALHRFHADLFIGLATVDNHVLAVLERLNGSQAQPPAAAPSALALGRPLVDGIGEVSQWFGLNPDFYGRFGLAGHNGLDYGAAPGVASLMGAAVLACHAGRCELGHDAAGFGEYVKVTAEDGSMSTLYGHLSAVLVTDNELIAAGAQLGNVGSTGCSTGPHLHLGWRVAGVRNPAYGDWVDPVLGRKAHGDA